MFRVVVVFFILVAATVASAGSERVTRPNLVANPTFDATGNEPVPHWEYLSPKDAIRTELVGGLRLEPANKGATGSAFLRQKLELPEGTRAFRLSVRATSKDLPNGSMFVFFDEEDLTRPSHVRLGRSFKNASFERDLDVPAGVRSARLVLAFTLRDSLTIHDVQVVPIDPKDVRVTAKVVLVEGAIQIKPLRSSVEDVDYEFSFPRLTQTQIPLSFVAGLSKRRSRKAVLLEPSLGQLIAAGPKGLSTPFVTEWRARVLVLERWDRSRLPDRVGLKTKGIPRGGAGWLEGGEDEKWKSRAAPLLRGEPDLRTLVARVRRKAKGGGSTATGIFRGAGVPAREVSLIRIGGGARLAVEIYQPKLGWLLVGLEDRDPFPLPYGDHVYVGFNFDITGPDPATPIIHQGLARGEYLTDRANAVEVAAFAVDEKLANELIRAVREGWSVAESEAELETDAASLSSSRKLEALHPLIPVILGR
jgi:hypothetical protein